MEYFIIAIGLVLVYVAILRLRLLRAHHHFYLRRLKEEEARFLHLEKMASLGALSGGIAHEINNPLTFIITNFDLLKKYLNQACFTDSDDRRKELAEEIKTLLGESLEGTTRIKRIVQDLLSFAHPSQGKRILSDLNQLLDTVLRILWNTVKYKVELVKDYKLATPIWVDPSQISQVFLNIILNGVQAIADKGVINVSTYEADSKIYVKIADNGCGIEKQHFAKIFEPFFTTKTGTGLGLHVSREIIKEYGGDITGESSPGEGSTFIVSLPAALGSPPKKDFIQ